MPKNVRVAVLLLWIYTAISILSGLSIFHGSKIYFGSFFPLVILFLLAAPQIFLIINIRSGRNWARVIMIVFVVLWALQTILYNHKNYSIEFYYFLESVRTGEISIVSAAARLLAFPLGVISSILLLGKSANEWFKSTSNFNQQPNEQTHSRCTECRELVRKDANICKHCGHRLIEKYQRV